MTRKTITKIALWKTKADKTVPRSAPMKMILATLLSVSAIFLICLLKPIKKPVLNFYMLYAARASTFPKE